jgi:hypothetical protein
VFVSYASVDLALAESVAAELQKYGLEVFLAAVSIHPGTNGTDAIRSNLQNSKWVFVLASRIACQSAFVQQEIGGATRTSRSEEREYPYAVAVLHLASLPSP